MSDRPYSRIYWEVVDDPKFDGVREDVRHFGTWSLMLVVADMAWPAPAFLPPVPKASVSVLVANGLVDVLTGGRYRIRGLDKERGERQERARASASSRVQRPLSDRSATAKQTLSDRSPRAIPAVALLDETRLDETSRAERAPVLVVIDYIEERTGRPYSFGAGSTVHETLSADVRDFGVAPVLGAMQADTTKHPDIGQLVYGATRLLHPIANPKDTAKTEQGDADRRASDARVAATRRMLDQQERLRGESA